MAKETIGTEKVKKPFKIPFNPRIVNQDGGDDKRYANALFLQKIQEVLNLIGTEKEIKELLGANGERARLAIRKVFTDITSLCEKEMFDEKTGEIKNVIKYGDFFRSLTVDEAWGMQIILAGYYGTLAFIYSNLLARTGLDYRGIKIAQLAAYTYTKKEIERLNDKATEKHIEARIAMGMRDTYIEQAKCAMAVEYLETIMEAIVVVRNVLESKIRLERDDRIADATLSKD